MKKYTPIAFEINLRPDGFVFDVHSLMAALMDVQDLRDARGLRYALVTVLVFVVLAKLSGEDFMRALRYGPLNAKMISPQHWVWLKSRHPTTRPTGASWVTR